MNRYNSRRVILIIGGYILCLAVAIGWQARSEFVQVPPMQSCADEMYPEPIELQTYDYLK